MTTVYDFNLKDKKGNEVSLSQYQGKVLLIVNTATGCGFTPQYEELEAMYGRLKEQGLEILDIPCDQFGHQTPGSDEEITQFCTMKFGTDFPQFKKSEKGFEGQYEEKLAAIMEKLYNEHNPEPRKKDDIQWNFTKFVVDKNGAVVARFEPTDDMSKVEECIKSLL